MVIVHETLIEGEGEGAPDAVRPEHVDDGVAPACEGEPERLWLAHRVGGADALALREPLRVPEGDCEGVGLCEAEAEGEGLALAQALALASSDADAESVLVALAEGLALAAGAAVVVPAGMPAKTTPTE